MASIQSGVTAMHEYKQGVMQALFSGKLRFKDENGNPYPDWEEKTLGDIASFSKGTNISKGDISENGETEAIRYGELYTRYGEIIDSVYSRTNLSIEKLVFSKAGDVIIPASGETHLDIATASCVLREGIALSGDINIVRSKETVGTFLAYYLGNAKKMDIARLAQGVSVVHLYSSNLQNLKVKLPCIEEQQKISDFLKCLDDKIKIEEEKLTQAKNFKKSLLQRMFV